MKPSREEVLRVANECGFLPYITRECSPSMLERFAAAMYEAGAASERAVSDRLLAALTAIRDARQNAVGFRDLKIVAAAIIAEVEAMRKENKE